MKHIEFRKQNRSLVSSLTSLARSTGLGAAILSAAGASALTGCGAAEDTSANELQEDVGQTQDEVYLANGAALFTANSWTVPVCFTTAGRAADKATIRSRIESQWGGNSALTFTGWGDCPASPSAQTVTIKLLWSDGVAGGGVTAYGMGGRLGDGTQMNLWVDSAKTLQGIFAVHEMGHALGLWHEHQRGDRTNIGCLTDPNANDQVWVLPGGGLASPFDPNSVMNYCRDIDGDGHTDMDMGTETNDNFQLSRFDKAGIQLVYGVPPAWGRSAGFVWSTTQVGTSPFPQYTYNSSGATNNTVTKTGTGTYRVDFPRIGSTAGGNVQVSAYGGNHRCKVNGWGASGATLQVNVSCTTAGGVAADGAFSAAYNRRSDFPTSEGGYVWANNATAASYTPSTTYSWNSSNGANTVTRSGTGLYRVAFGGLTLSSGTVHVTAYGSGSEYCKVTGWGGGAASVACFTKTGAAVDTLFTLDYSQASPAGSPSWGYAWANNATAASYTPSTTFQRIATNRGDGSTNSGGTVTITRSGAGIYAVNFPNLMASADPLVLYGKSNVLVTAYGSGSDYCNVASWGGGASNGLANVRCYTAAGAAKDTTFTVTFSSTVAR